MVLTTTYEYALFYLKKGISILPIKSDGSKKPNLETWMPYQTTLATEEEATKWFKDTTNNIGIIGGRVSGNLIVIDFDDLEKLKEFEERVNQSVRISKLLESTWRVKTGKGVHLYLRLKQDWLGGNKLRAGYDIKAEAGYVVAPPSLHSSGKLYSFIENPEQREIVVIDNYEDFIFIMSALGNPLDSSVDKSGVPFDSWCECLLKTRITDGRRVIVKRILLPYLVSVKNYGEELILKEIHNWLELSKDIPQNKPLSESELKNEIAWTKKRDVFPIDLAVAKKLFAEKGVTEFAIFHYKAINEHQKLLRAKTEPPKEKPEILLPGIGNPIGDVASELGRYYNERQALFYDVIQREVVRLELVGIDNKKPGGANQILGLRAVDKDAFITMIEKDFNIGVIVPKDEDEGTPAHFVRKSITGAAAGAILSSADQFRSALPIIQKIFTVPKPIIRNKVLEFPQKGYDKNLMSWTPHDAPNVKTDMDIIEAKALIEKIFREFCFVSPQDKTNAIAGLLTPFCRGLYDHETARTPLFFYMANRERAGKDYLAGVTGVVYEGSAIEDSALCSDNETHDEEFRKKVLSTCKVGRTRIHSSNNKGFLNSGELEGVITKEFITDRQLGGNTMLTFPNILEISLSANTGITYTPDLSRRCVFINLFLAEEDPNARVFETPNLHEMLFENRGEVLSALYALVREWVANGMKQGSKPFTSFHEWARVVGGIMENAGLGCPAQNDSANNIGGDTETMDMKRLYEVCYSKWPDTYVPKAKLIQEFEDPNSDFSGIFGWLDWANENLKARMRFGRTLEKYRGRIMSDICMNVKEEPGHSGRNQYQWTKKTNIVLAKQPKLATLGALGSSPLSPHVAGNLSINNTSGIETHQSSQSSQEAHNDGTQLSTNPPPTPPASTQLTAGLAGGPLSGEPSSGTPNETKSNEPVGSTPSSHKTAPRSEAEPNPHDTLISTIKLIVRLMRERDGIFPLWTVAKLEEATLLKPEIIQLALDELCRWGDCYSPFTGSYKLLHDVPIED